MSVTTMAEPQPVKEEEKPSLKLEEDCKSPPAMTPVRKDSRSPSVKDEVKAEASTPQRKGKPCPQLIGHLPRAEEEALQTFTVLTGNHYQYGTLGRSEDVFESLSCDCQYEHGEHTRLVADAYVDKRSGRGGSPFGSLWRRLGLY